MLKITRKGVSIIVPNYWLNGSGFLKHKAVHAIKLFFGDETLEQALKEAKRNVRYGWNTSKGVEIKEGKGDD
jgi:hypothetical protein